MSSKRSAKGRDQGESSRHAPRGRTRRSRRPSPSPSPSPPPSPPPMPNQLPWPMRDRAMQERYNILASREVDCTRFIDFGALEHLELTERVQHYLDTIGWTWFARTRLPGYTELTFEFLSSLEAILLPSTNDLDECIKFRLMGNDYILSLAQLNQMFGFPNDGWRTFSDNFVPQGEWVTMTRDPQASPTSVSDIPDYNPSSAKASKIWNPALRYLHRFMAQSIFARGDSQGVVSSQELFILTAMHRGYRVNSGFWLLKHLLSVARKPTGKICVGSIVSIIASSLGVALQDPIHTRIGGHELIDLPMLVYMRMAVKDKDGSYLVKLPDGSIVPKQRPPVHPPAEHQDPIIPPEVPIPNISFPPPPSDIPSSSRTMDDKLDYLIDQMHDLRAYVTTRFDTVEGRITSLEEAMESIRNRP